MYFCPKGVKEEMGQSMRDYRVRIQRSCHKKCHSGRENWTREVNKCKKSLNLKASWSSSHQTSTECPEVPHRYLAIPPSVSPAGDFIGPAAPQPARFPQSKALILDSVSTVRGRRRLSPGGFRGAAGSCPTHRHCFFLPWHLQPTHSPCPRHHCNTFLHLLTTAPAGRESQEQPRC